MGWTDLVPKIADRKDDDKPFPFSCLELTPEGEAKYNEISNFTRTQLAVTTAIAGCSFGLGVKFGKWHARPPWKRFTNVQDIPSSHFGATSPWLKGRVVSVSDGDTIRFLHTPLSLFSSQSLKSNEKLSIVALPIRICTIDTPETAKFGKPGQAHGETAKEKLSSMILEKRVQIRLLEKDQYSRAVAEVRKNRFFFLKQYMDEAMLKAGLAEVYQGSGAVYGRRGKDGYLALEATARKKRIGIWADADRESAAEFKARTK